MDLVLKILKFGPFGLMFLVETFSYRDIFFNILCCIFGTKDLVAINFETFLARFRHIVENFDHY